MIRVISLAPRECVLCQVASKMKLWKTCHPAALVTDLDLISVMLPFQSYQSDFVAVLHAAASNFLLEILFQF